MLTLVVLLTLAHVDHPPHDQRVAVVQHTLGYEVRLEAQLRDGLLQHGAALFAAAVRAITEVIPDAVARDCNRKGILSEITQKSLAQRLIACDPGSNQSSAGMRRSRLRWSDLTETADHISELQLRHQAGLIRGDHIVTVAVFVGRRLADQPLGLSDVPDIGDVPVHAGVTVAVEHVADASLPHEL